MIYHTHTFATEAEAEAFAAGVEFAHRENLIVEAIEPAAGFAEAGGDVCGGRSADAGGISDHADVVPGDQEHG